MKTKLSISLLLILALLLGGCSSNQVIDNLQLAVDAVSIAIPLIGPAAGLPAGLTAQISTYLGSVSQAITKASDILSGTGTDAQKAAQIASAFAAIIAPDVPAQYQGIAAAVQKVASLVLQFLQSLPGKTAVSGKTTTFSASDLAKLRAIRAQAQLGTFALKRP